MALVIFTSATVKRSRLSLWDAPPLKKSWNKSLGKFLCGSKGLSVCFTLYSCESQWLCVHVHSSHCFFGKRKGQKNLKVKGYRNWGMASFSRKSFSDKVNLWIVHHGYQWVCVCVHWDFFRKVWNNELLHNCEVKLVHVVVFGKNILSGRIRKIRHAKVNRRISWVFFKKLLACYQKKYGYIFGVKVIFVFSWIFCKNCDHFDVLIWPHRMTSGGAEDSVATVPVPIARKIKLDQQVGQLRTWTWFSKRLSLTLDFFFELPQKQLIESRQKQKRRQSGMPHASDARETAATGRVGSAASGTGGSGVRRPLRSQMSTSGSNATNSNTIDNPSAGIKLPVPAVQFLPATLFLKKN